MNTQLGTAEAKRREQALAAAKTGFGEFFSVGLTIENLKLTRELIIDEIAKTETFTQRSASLHRQIDGIDSAVKHLENVLAVSQLIKSFK